jgi:hypothetical protein
MLIQCAVVGLLTATLAAVEALEEFAKSGPSPGLIRFRAVLVPGVTLLVILLICAELIVVMTAPELSGHSILYFSSSAGLGIVAGWQSALIGTTMVKNVDRNVGRLCDLFAERGPVVWIATSFLASVIVTWPLGISYGLSNGSGFWGNFYVNWTASLAFWTIVGVVVSVVSIARPEELAFFERIRILTGAKSSPEVQDISRRIRQECHVNEYVEYNYHFESWAAEHEAYWVLETAEMRVRNLLHDESILLLSSFSHAPDEFKNRGAGADYGTLEYYRIVGVDPSGTKFPQSFGKEGFERRHSPVTLGPNDTKTIQWCVRTLYASKKGYPEVRHEFSTPRFTRVCKLAFSVSPGCPQMAIELGTANALDGSLNEGIVDPTLQLGPNRPLTETIQNVPADKTCFRFKLGP